jgi:PAS domain S-box-containing protein
MTAAPDPPFLDELEVLHLFDALPRAVVVTDNAGVIRLWNRTAEQVYGWRADEVVGRSVVDVLIPGHQREQGLAIIDDLRNGTAWEGDVTVLHRDGTPRRVWATERPITNDDGAVIGALGASEDVTELRMVEQRNADLTAHLQLALDAGGLGTWRWDLATGVTEWDDTTYRLFGIEPGSTDISYDDWTARLHPDDADDVIRHVDEAVAARGSYLVNHRVVWPDGTVRWLQGAGRVTLDADGEPTGTIGAISDVTEQMEAAEEERIGRERLEVLATINDELTAARDRGEVAARAVRAAVPLLGDWCTIYVLPDATSTVPDIEVAHVDPEMVALARRLQTEVPYDPDAPTGMPRVIRTGAAELHPDITDEQIDAAGLPPEQAALARRLQIRSVIAVPLVKGGRVLGGLQLISSSARRRYDESDLALARAVAGRIAASLENRRLSDEQRTIAATLQASLLPFDLPNVAGLELAVRYRASGAGVDVGGDFYDVFQLADDRWGVVIGDVCGTGPEAAALTGLVRHTIASAAWHGDDPAAVLDHLNRAMLDRGIRSFCTVAYGVVRSTGDGAELTLAIGGHPLPIVVAPDGTLTTCGRPGEIIGAFDDFTATTQRCLLEPGATVVFYTDGAIDVAPPHHLEPDELASMVGAAVRAGGSADDVATRIEDALGAHLDFNRRTDDVALLVLRVAR